MSTITIDGTAYDIDEVLMRVELNHLLYLKQKLDIGMKSILGGLEKLKASQDGVDEDDKTARGEAVMGALEDVQVLNAFRAIVWIVRAKAGHRAPDGSYLTVDAASEGVSLFDLGGDESEDDEESPKDEAGTVEAAAVTPS